MPLTKSELLTFLNEPRMAHLATATSNGKPRVNPIWFVYDQGCFYFSTRMGRVKGNHIQQNPNVALSIATDDRPYLAVCAFGKAEVVQKDRDKWLEKISTRYGEQEAGSWVTKVVKQPDRVVIKLQPDRLLSWNYERDDAERQDRGESMTTPIS
jgi:PPOX class probable F420-dependent enzyme